MKIKSWTVEQLKLLKNHYADSNISIKELSKLIGRSEQAIIQKACKLKIHRFSQIKDSSIEFLKNNYHNLQIPHKIFEAEIGRSWPTILLLAKSLGLKRTISYTPNSNYFNSIDCWEKSYIIGLFWADAHNSIIENRISIGLQEQDKHILESINNIIQKDTPLMFKPGRIAKGYRQKSKNQYVLRIRDKTISQKLLEYGMTSNKTKTLKFPTCIPDQFLSAFILGYFDGDGCIYLGKKCSNKVSICGTLSMLTEIKRILIENCNVSDVKIRQVGNIYDIAWSKKEDLKNIRSFLYSNATLYLQRKYNKFHSIEN